MKQQEFDALASRGYSHIPVVHEILADLDTPLSAYLKVADAPYSYLLESAGQGGEMWGRYSIIGLPARTVIRVRGQRVTVEEDGEVVEQTETSDPLAFVEAFSQRFNVPDLPDLPRFFGGLVGYFGYDTIRYVEKRLAQSTPPDDLGTPDMLLMVSTDVIVFDNVAARMKLISLVEPSQPNALQQTVEALEARARQLDASVPRIAESSANQTVEESDFESASGQANFQDAVERIREYIRAGDVMQVVLSQRMSIPFASPPINLYRALRGLNPSPYMYFMNLDDFHIVSSSPEILARVETAPSSTDRWPARAVAATRRPKTRRWRRNWSTTRRRSPST